MDKTSKKVRGNVDIDLYSFDDDTLPLLLRFPPRAMMQLMNAVVMEWNGME
jgi:hypothetical protein